MSDSHPQPEERLSEELVAYLDGELSAAESEAVENRISSDDHMRSELQKFDRVWNALDQLPPATVGDSFTKTTIEMVTVEAKEELARETAMLPIRRRNRWLKVTGMAAAAALVGFTALAVLLPNPNRQLYANLPVILELDAYSEVRDIEFLRLLNSTSGDWLLAGWGGEVDADAKALADLTLASYAERRQYVDELDSDARTDLAAKHRRYQSLTPEMREELNQWHTRLASDPDAAKLQKTMLAYYAWVSETDELDQARLRSMGAVERVERVERMQKWAERQNEQRLSPANSAALRNALDAIVADPEIKKLHAAMVASLPDLDAADDAPDGGRDFRRDGLKALKQSSPRMAVLMIEMASGFGRREPPFPRFVEFRDAIERRLIDAVDDDAARRLEEMSQQDRSRRLAMWLMMSGRPPQEPDVATLEDYFASGSLSREEQQKLLAKPENEMLEELERRYVQEFLGDSGETRDFQRMMQGFGRGGRFGGRGRWSDRDDRGQRGPGPGGERGPGPPGEGPPPDGRPPRDGRPPEGGPRGAGPPPPPGRMEPI